MYNKFQTTRADADFSVISENQKLVVFLCPGPEYLFFTSGIFYAWELASRYNVILLLDFPFRKVEILDGLKKEGVIKDYLSVDTSQGTLSLITKYKKHRSYYKTSKFLFRKYQPVAIFLHSDIPPLNIYLFEEAFSKNIPRFIYKASAVLSDGNLEVDTLKMLQKVKLARKYKLPYWMAGCCYEIKLFIGYCLNYWLLPYLNKGHIFKPRLNPFRKEGRWLNCSKNYFDYSLTHTDKERKALLETTGEECNVIQFPMIQVGGKVFNFLYGSIKEQDMVLVLPTDGEADYIMKTQRVSKDIAVKRYYKKWVEAINIIADKLPSHKIGVKFKSNEDHELFKQYLARLGLGGRIIIISPAEDTNALILKSNVIVSTISTVLWWANFLQSRKCLISLDLFDNPSGNYYENVNGILHFNSTEALKNFNFSEIPPQHEKIESKVTLTQFMQTHVGL